MKIAVICYIFVLGTNATSPTTTSTTTTSTVELKNEVTTTKSSLPSGDEPSITHWQVDLVTSKNSSSKDYPRRCLEECKKNCTMDSGHKCFGKIRHSKEM